MARRTRPDAQSLTFTNYRCIYVALLADLLEDEFEEAEAEDAALEDWERDSPDGQSIDRPA